MGNGCKRPSKVFSINPGKRSVGLRSFWTVLANYCSMISYPNYKFQFTIKALGMFAKKYGDFEVLESRTSK